MPDSQECGSQRFTKGLRAGAGGRVFHLFWRTNGETINEALIPGVTF
jgi:hypothetical protein